VASRYDLMALDADIGDPMNSHAADRAASTSGMGIRHGGGGDVTGKRSAGKPKQVGHRGFLSSLCAGVPGVFVWPAISQRSTLRSNWVFLCDP
jgi:hypothetical protein